MGLFVEFDLEKAHEGFRAPIEQRFTELLRKYPRAALTKVYVGEPRKEHDISMGYYDQDRSYIWLNGYWFSQDPKILQTAAKSDPLFHGKMVDEPAHVVTHEFGHALEYGIGFDDIDKRARQVWADATKNPKRAPAQYGLTNPTEYLAELFACVELGHATDDQQQQLRYVLG